MIEEVTAQKLDQEKRRVRDKLEGAAGTTSRLSERFLARARTIFPSFPESIEKYEKWTQKLHKLVWKKANEVLAYQDTKIRGPPYPEIGYEAKRVLFLANSCLGVLNLGMQEAMKKELSIEDKCIRDHLVARYDDLLHQHTNDSAFYKRIHKECEDLMEDRDRFRKICPDSVKYSAELIRAIQALDAPPDLDTAASICKEKCPNMSLDSIQAAHLLLNSAFTNYCRLYKQIKAVMALPPLEPSVDAERQLYLGFAKQTLQKTHDPLIYALYALLLAMKTFKDKALDAKARAPPLMQDIRQTWPILARDYDGLNDAMEVLWGIWQRHYDCLGEDIHTEKFEGATGIAMRDVKLQAFNRANACWQSLSLHIDVVNAYYESETSKIMADAMVWLLKREVRDSVLVRGFEMMDLSMGIGGLEVVD